MNDIALAGRLLAACCAVAAVLAAFRYAALALGHAADRRGPRSLAVLETAHLPGGASLHVVRVGERRIVISRAAGRVDALCTLPPSAPVAAPSPAVRMRRVRGRPGTQPER